MQRLGYCMSLNLYIWDSKSVITPLARDLLYLPLKRGRNTQTSTHTDMASSESIFLLYAYQEFIVLYKPSNFQASSGSYFLKMLFSVLCSPWEEKPRRKSPESNIRKPCQLQYNVFVYVLRNPYLFRNSS